MPRLPVVIYPALVQGEGAGAQVAAAIRSAGERRECDVLILCRGGGSIEDLWAFNEEPVARAMAACPIPIVTGVGHETDFTIADFVADVRAPTPTAAAELVSPDRAELAARLRVLAGRVHRCLLRALEQRIQQVDFLARRLVHPGRRIAERRRHLAHLRNRLGSALARGVAGLALPVSRLAHRLGAAVPDLDRLQREQGHLRARLLRAQQVGLDRRAERVARLHSHLVHLDPRQVLQRGYSIVTTEQGRIVRSSAEVQAGDAVGLEFGQGEAGARITHTK
jgi:exodeoxyribonuclease VII large subunit